VLDGDGVDPAVLTDHPVSITGAGLALLAATVRDLALLLFAQPTA